MESGTSFFSRTLFRKQVARFWPLWALYFTIWLFLLPVQVLALRGYEDIRREITNFLWNVPAYFTAGTVLAFLFGVLCAMAVFGYLYTARAACMMHALPLRRESLFFSCYGAGLFMLLAPNVVIFLCTVAAAACRGVFEPVPLLIWLGMQCAVCLFFYSFAVFCAMFTGHILALPAFYGVLNVLVMGIVALVEETLPTFLYGYGRTGSALGNLVMWATPLVHILRQASWYRSGTATTGTVEGWHIVAVYAAAGIALTLFALWVYRRRHVETAGDVVAVRLVRPLFRCGVGFCAGLSFGILTSEIIYVENPLPLALLCLFWGVAGYLAAEMLIQKSFRVAGSWRRCAAFTGAFALMFVILAFDLIGFERRVPRTDQIQSVYVSQSGGYGGFYSGYPQRGIENPAAIEKVLALHQAIVQQGENAPPGEDSLYFTVDYQMKSGTMISRYYRSVPLRQEDRNKEGTVTRAYLDYLADPARSQKENQVWLQLTAAQVVSVNVSELWDSAGGYMTGATVDRAERDLTKLLDAIRADLAAGALPAQYPFYQDYLDSGPYVTSLHVEWQEDVRGREPQWRYGTLQLNANAKNTLAVLRELGVITQERYPVSPQEYEALQSGGIKPESAAAGYIG